jgi:CubicO group peptidase (beta-lactamase class C family)
MKLERVTPLAVNIPPKAIIKLLEAVKEENHQVHGLMMLKNGKVFFERYWQPYGPLYRHQLFSLSKSFTSTAVGFAVQEGLLTVETKIADIFKDEFEKLGNKIDDEVRGITIKNLLTMSTGMEYENWGHDGHQNNILSFLSAHIKDTPGQTFRYSSISTFMCSAAVTRLTGKTVEEYLTPRLFEPLGIENFHWTKDNETGVSMGGFGLNITLEDIARFGQFILQKGVWEGKRLLSAEWIDEATSKHIENGTDPDNDWGCGYGYQFWRCVPDGVFRGDGMFGQYCVFVPEQDIVIAANSNLDMGRFLKLVWEMLKDFKAMSVNEADLQALDAINNLTYLSTDKPGDAYPTLRGFYKAEKDDMADLYFDFNGSDGVVTATFEDGKALAYYFEHGKWTKGASAFMPDGFRFSGDRCYRTVTFGAWEGRVFTVTNWHYEAAHKSDLRFTFNDDCSEVKLHIRGHNFNDSFEEVATAKKINN